MNTKVHAPGILILYFCPLLRKSPSTLTENITSFGLYSNFSVWEVNTVLGFPKNLSKLRFDVVILHYSLFGRGYQYEMSEPFYDYLVASKDSYKIAFFQDEYRYCKKRFQFINDFHIDTIYTCVEPAYHEVVYRKFTNAKHIFSCLPGYVSHQSVNAAKKFALPQEKRRIDIGYRARRLAFYMGKGAQEKHEIGLEFQKLCKEKKLNMKFDISVEREDRLYSDDWFRFIGNCKAVLGVESGVSIFDLHDEVRIACDGLIERNPTIDFAEVYDKVLHKWENNVPLRTISPRHFEAATFKTCQILFEGNYSGILKPNVHYLTLKKDFSNFGEIISNFQDDSVKSRIIRNAYNDLIASDQYSYQTFIETFDTHLTKLGLNPDLKFNKRDVDKIIYEDRWQQKARIMIRRIKFPGKTKIRPTIKKFSKQIEKYI